MRKITPPQITLFFLLFGSILLLGIITAYGLLGALPLGDFRGVSVVGGAIVLVYLYGFAVYRLFLHFMPLKEGELAEGSREEFAAQVNILFYLMLFNSLIRTHFLPVPLMRLVYLALGARLGENTYSAGTLLDPPLTEFGANCIIGHDAVLFCHAIEGQHFALSRIRVGDNVTIGATAVIMSGVQIGDGAIVSAGAVVLKDTHIGPNEVWGGVPAKRLR
ncbi:MAG: acyltransferase [Gammaproteobacteria bacterium]|nr:acyltransferase [Gammaproteobacteria bacterium]MBU1977937.1 acyltransferase [Gammaproteobacteria bacterium]